MPETTQTTPPTSQSATTKDIATSGPKELGPAGRLNSLLDKPSVRKRFDEMLGKRAPAFISSIVSAVSGNKELAKCEPMSVISSAAIAAAMDLPINPSLGFAHIVPYGGVATFQMGWKGFIQLAMRSGQYKTINVTPVKEGQLKSHNTFTGEMEFNMDATGPKTIGFLLYFKLLNGYEKYYYMTTEQAQAHGMRYSASFKRGFGKWKDDFESMALKTVVKMGLGKYGILSIEMQKAFTADEAAVDDDGEAREYPDRAPELGVTEKPKRTKSRLSEVVDAHVTPSATEKPTAAEPEDTGEIPNEGQAPGDAPGDELPL